MKMPQLSKIIFSEGKLTRKIIGEIISRDDMFIVLQTLKKKMEINRNIIIKIEEYTKNE